MTLLAGAVEAILGARFTPPGPTAFDGRMKKSIALTTRTENAVKRAGDRGTKAFHAFGRAAGVTAVGGTAGLAVATGLLVKKAMEYEQQMSATVAATSANVREQKLLEAQNKRLGASTKFSALEA